MTDAILTARNLTRHFKIGSSLVPAMNGVNLTIARGTTYGLIGESGCGKSTVALSLSRLQDIDSGSIHFENQDITKLHGSALRPIRTKLRLLFQNPEMVLNTGMTVKSILMEEVQKLDLQNDEKINQLLQDTLEKVGLGSRHLNRYPASLSTGEKQRAAIARALITVPSFLICDEPVASLDLSLKAGIINLLMDLQDRLGLTYLFISHNLGLVSKMAHTIGIMYMGYLVEEAPSQFFSPTKVMHPYSRLLLASVPSIHTEEYKVILSQYPDVEPQRLSVGCPFRNRCPLYRDNPDTRCEKEIPVLRSLTAKRKVACHQVEDVRVVV